MSKRNEIKKILFSAVYNAMKKINENISEHNKHPRSFTIDVMDVITDTKSYLRKIKYNLDQLPEEIQFFNAGYAKDLELLNKVFPIRDLFIEAHFISKAIEENYVHPNLHASFKKNPDLRVWKKGDGNYVIDDMTEVIASDLSKLAKEKYKDDYSKIGNYFTKIEEPQYDSLNQIYKRKVSGMTNPLLHHKIAK